eukprot:7902145-Ditylum_brightwellii.AAC.1
MCPPDSLLSLSKQHTAQGGDFWVYLIAEDVGMSVGLLVIQGVRALIGTSTSSLLFNSLIVQIVSGISP